MRADTPATGPGLDAAALVAAATGAAFATDRDGVVRCWNRAAAELLGFAEEDACGHHVDPLLQPRDVHGNRLRRAGPPALELALEGDPIHPFQMTLRTAAGERVPVLAGVVVVLSAADEKRHRVIHLLQRTHRRRRSDEVIERLLAQPTWERPGAADTLRRHPLTPRQREVLQVLAQGEAPREIAELLSVSVYTVRSHLRAIYRKLEVHSQSEAVAKAYKLRLL